LSKNTGSNLNLPHNSLNPHQSPAHGFPTFVVLHQSSSFHLTKRLTEMTNPSEAPATVAALAAAERYAIETFYGAWKQQRPDLLEEVCTPDWQDIPLGPGQALGPQGLGAIIRQFTTAFPDTEIIIHEIFGTHERAGVRAEISFTNRHAVPGVAGTGQRVSIALHEFHHLHDGKLTHTWHLEAGAFMPYAIFSAQYQG